jgi:CBS domain containing-hemolysin-like protein
VTGWYLLAAVLLLLANGFFVGAEFALTAARRTKLEQMADEGNARAKLALSSARELTLMLAGAQLGITIASLGLGYVAEPAVADLIERGISPIAELPEGLLHTISFVVALTIIVFLHMVVGEMAPKNIAIARPEESALWLAAPFRAYVVLFRPVIRLLNGLANEGCRIVGVEPRDEVLTAHSAEEIRLMIEESAREGMVDSFERRLLSGATRFGELDAAAAMVPRTEMVAVSISANPEDLERTVLESGLSRIPIYGRDLDNVLGFFHAKDLLKIEPQDRDRPVARPLIRPMLVVPESRRLYPLLIDMRREGRHVSLVVDEHGGTAGVVTIEDLVEELVGEIRDEYDVAELDIERLAPDRFVVPGSLRIDEVAEQIGVELPKGPYETVSGFLMDRLGRIPKRRDVVEHDGWNLRVRRMHRRRIVQVLIERAT